MPASRHADMHSDVLGNQLQIEDHAKLLKKVSLRDRRNDTTRLSRILNQLHDAFGRRTGTARWNFLCLSASLFLFKWRVV